MVSARKIVVLVAALLVVIVSVNLLPVRELLETVFERIEALGPWAGPAFVVFYIPACLLTFPDIPMNLGAGAVFGTWPATLYVTLGRTLGTAAVFLAVRYVMRDWVARRIKPHSQIGALMHALEHEELKILFLIRLAPIMPANYINFAFGLTPVSLRSFMLATCFGMIPRTLLFAYLGNGARSISAALAGELELGPGAWVRYAVVLGLSLLATVWIVFLTRRAIREVQETHGPPPGLGERLAEENAP